MWHRLLLFFGIRNDFDWAPPGLGPEVNHPFIAHGFLRCCLYCGGGSMHAIHREPYDLRRSQEVIVSERARVAEVMRQAREAALADATKAAYPDHAGDILDPGTDQPVGRGFVEREHGQYTGN